MAGKTSPKILWILGKRPLVHAGKSRLTPAVENNTKILKSDDSWDLTS